MRDTSRAPLRRAARRSSPRGGAWEARAPPEPRELGPLHRLTFAGVEAGHPEEAERRRWQGKFYHRPAGAESWADVALRLRSWVADADRDGRSWRVPAGHPGLATDGSGDVLAELS